MNLDLSIFSRFLVTIAILMQLYQLRINNRICSNAFFIYAFGSYLMAYNYYNEDNKELTTRIKFKLFNSTMLLLIAILSR